MPLGRLARSSVSVSSSTTKTSPPAIGVRSADHARGHRRPRGRARIHPRLRRRRLRRRCRAHARGRGRRGEDDPVDGRDRRRGRTGATRAPVSSSGERDRVVVLGDRRPPRRCARGGTRSSSRTAAARARPRARAGSGEGLRARRARCRHRGPRGAAGSRRDDTAARGGGRRPMARCRLSRDARVRSEAVAD